MKRILLCFLYLCAITLCKSQNISEPDNNKTTIVRKKDTININDKYQLVISLPSKSVKTASTYESGFFISYFIPADTTTISIFSGSLPAEPLVSGSNCIVTDSILINEVFFERKGFCENCGIKLSNRKGFFMEKELKLLHYSIKYEWVPERKISLYNNLFSDMEIIERK
jgi:hypothetical protein